MPTQSIERAPEQGGTTAEELAYRLRQQQITAEYGRFAMKTHDIDTLLQEATRACAEGLQTALCKVLEYLPADDEFIVRAGVGWHPGVVGHARAGADEASPAGYAFKTGASVISNHLEAESRFRTPALLRDHNVKRAINVLIQGNAGRFGVLEVDSPVDGRFSEADLGFMQGFANLLGLSIERQTADDERRAAEERLRDSQQSLELALAHQEVLTREVSHRVKNSLGVVAGLLRIQGRMSTNPELTGALNDAESRVHTIARVHDQLWQKNEVHTVDLAELLGDLCQDLRSSLGPGNTLKWEIEPAATTSEQAIPLGLLTNELVTNAFKYAYPAGGNGEVVVSLKRDAASGQLRLIVCDNGVGLPADFDASRSKSLGMKLISSLATQIGGRAEWKDMTPGTRFALVFPQTEAV